MADSEGRAGVAEERHRELGIITRTLAHDLNNCLHVVANVGEVLAMSGTLPAEDVELLDDLQQCAERAVALVEALRVSGRAAWGPRGRIDTRRLLDEVVVAAESAGDGRRTLVTDLAAELPAIHGDDVQLYYGLTQVVLAVLAAAAAGVAPRLRATAAADPPPVAGFPDGQPGWLILEVSAPRTDLEPTQLAQIMDLTEKGLGHPPRLLVAQRVFAAHDGAMALEPEHPRITVYLPWAS